MKYLIPVLCWLMVAPLFMAGRANAQCTSGTGENATVIFPRAAVDVLIVGDIIQAYYDVPMSDASLCVGEKVFTGSGFALTVWGDDSMTEAIDGMPVGVEIQYRILRNGQEYLTTVLYVQGDGVYQPGAIFTVRELLPLVQLPVELTRFEAVADRMDILLRWDTASETNNAGFEIHSRLAAADPGNGDAGWEVLGFVDGHGTTEEPQHYRFRVEDAEAGRHLFRLKQVDYDGAFEYSPEVEVFVSLPGAYVLSAAYPNPFNPETHFTLTVAARQHAVVAVHDVQGRRVALLHAGVLEADRPHRFMFDARHLPSGLYFYRVTAERFAETRSMTLAK